MRSALILAGLCAGMVGARAQADDDDALRLADRTPVVVTEKATVHSFTEAGLERDVGAGQLRSAVLGIDVRGQLDGPPGWHLDFSDRLDAKQPFNEPGSGSQANSLRELYVNGALTPQWLVALGRMNVRNGVAQGYSPSDFFKPHALRSVLSYDPNELRADRLGIVAARTDWFSDSGAASLLIAPRLRNADQTGPLAADFGATNRESQALLTWTQKLTNDLKPQAAIYLQEHHALQWALQATTLLTQQLVAYAEWSGGHAPTMEQEALTLPSSGSFLHRSTVGATWTFPNKLSLTGEYSRNGAGFNAQSWKQLESLGAPAVGAVLLWANDAQDPPSRDNLYWQARWNDVPIDRVDLSAYLRQSLAERSHQAWVEVRYRARSPNEFYLQWLANGGPQGSVYGSVPTRQIFTLVWRHDFS